MRLDEICRLLEEKERNETLADNNGTTAMPEREGDSTIWDPLSNIASEVIDIFNNDTNTTINLQETFKNFHHFSEWYMFTTFCVLGIIMNCFAIVFLIKDVKMRKMARVLLITLIVAENLLQGALIAFFQLRHLEFTFSHPIEVKGALTTFVGALQAFCVWMLYVVATDAYRSVRYHQKTAKLVQLTQSPKDTALMTLLIVVYHVPFFPHVRQYLLYNFIPKGEWYSYNPCNVPVENHWDFDTTNIEPDDLYFIVYYSVGYFLIHYAAPAICLGCRDKDIIDVIHSQQDAPGRMSEEAKEAAITAFPISVMCNVTLVTITPKLTLLLFKQFEFAVYFIRSADAVFRFLNVLANGFLLTKSQMYLPVLLLYNRRIKTAVYIATCRRRQCLECKRPVSWAGMTPRIEIVEV